jgi:hypothetical protein
MIWKWLHVRISQVLTIVIGAAVAVDGGRYLGAGGGRALLAYGTMGHIKPES